MAFLFLRGKKGHLWLRRGIVITGLGYNGIAKGCYTIAIYGTGDTSGRTAILSRQTKQRREEKELVRYGAS